MSSRLSNSKLARPELAEGMTENWTTAAQRAAEQLGQLYNLKRDRGSGWEKPYKPALLLAWNLNRRWRRSI